MAKATLFPWWLSFGSLSFSSPLRLSKGVSTYCQIERERNSLCDGTGSCIDEDGLRPDGFHNDPSSD